MNRSISFFRSSIGKKWIVAVTGIAMVLFLVGHLLGNLQMFYGPGDKTHPAKINVYAKFLKDLGGALWIARGGLIVAVVLHVLFTIKLTIENRKAKGTGYQFKNKVQAKLSTRTMIWSGSYILCFIIFHLAHYTLLLVHPEYKYLHDATGLHDVYLMVILGFSSPITSAFYIVGMLLLCSHLSHGIGSVAQTLGLQSAKLRSGFQNAGRLIAAALALGYISIPAAVLAGMGKTYKEERLQAAAAEEECCTMPVVPKAPAPAPATTTPAATAPGKEAK